MINRMLNEHSVAKAMSCCSVGESAGQERDFTCSTTGAGRREYGDEVSLRYTRRGWEEPRPSHCPRCRGALGAGQVLVGVAQCGCGTVHRTHTCRGCQETIYTPPLGNSCLLQSLDDRHRRA